MPVIGQGSVYI